MEYMLDFLTPMNRRAAFIGETVIKVRQHSSPHRITSRFDHFEPGITGLFFAEQKTKLGRNINFERASSLDYFICSNAHSLLKSGRFQEADGLLSEVSWEQIKFYDWYHFGSFAWAGKRLGRWLGPRTFVYAKRALGRV
jgi:hypothetical protein